MPLITVLYPFLAECSAVGDLAGLRARLTRGLEVLAFLIVPMAIGLAVLRTEIVRFLFQRGAFDATDTRMTAFALLFYGAGLLFLVWREYLARTFYALQDTATPMWAGVAAVAVNIVLNLVLVRYLAHGGLALATSLAALIGSFLLLYLLRGRLGHIGGWRLVQEVGKVTVAALVMGLAVFMVNDSLPSFGCWASFEGVVSRCLGSGGLAMFAVLGLRLGLLIGFGAVVYALLCRVLRVREMAYALSLLRRLKARIAE